MVTTIIILITAFVTISAFGDKVTVLPKSFRHGEWFSKLDFYAYGIARNRQWYRFFTIGLVHVDWTHILFNMTTLFFFGYLVENSFTALWGAWGELLYLLFYISALGVSSIPDYFKHRKDPFFHAVGASGATSAVLFASIIISPNIGIMILFIPIPIPGYIFGLLFLAYSAYMMYRGNTRIGHLAHFAGAVYGFLFPLFFEPSLWKHFIDSF